MSIGAGRVCIALAAVLLAACDAAMSIDAPTRNAADGSKDSLPPFENVVFAEAHISPTQGYSASGTIRFVDEYGSVRINGELSGLTPGPHGLHIHEQGDCSAPDASSAGGHFEPDRDPHGSPRDPAEQHHIGDLGNISAGANGKATIDASDTEMTLNDGRASIVNRAVIVHSGRDKFESQPSGDAGERVGCGVIRALTAPDYVP
jgi:Cu-Zn family superoxide dismutase